MRNERHGDPGRAGIHVIRLPGGWLGRLLAVAIAVVLGVLALSFSLAILVLAFVAGLAVWIYFVARRALGGAPGGRRHDSGPAAGDEDGRVIEGEVIRAEGGASRSRRAAAGSEPNED